MQSPRPTLLLRWLFSQIHQQKATELGPSSFLLQTQIMASSLLFQGSKGKNTTKLSQVGSHAAKHLLV